MHAVFMLYGRRDLVDDFLKWLETRTFYSSFKNPKKLPNGYRDKDGKILTEGVIPVTAVVRYGALGTLEYVFPREAMNEVLTTLNFHKPSSFNGAAKIWEKFKNRLRFTGFRKLLNCKAIPKFDTSKEIMLPQEIKKHISIFPIGVRYDPDVEMDGILREFL